MMGRMTLPTTAVAAAAAATAAATTAHDTDHLGHTIYSHHHCGGGEGSSLLSFFLPSSVQGCSLLAVRLEQRGYNGYGESTNNAKPTEEGGRRIKICGRTFRYIRRRGKKCCTFLQGRQMLLLVRMIGATFLLFPAHHTNGPIAR